MKKMVAWLKELYTKHKQGIVLFLYVLLNAALIYYCIELGNKNPFFNGIFYTVINILSVFVVMSAVYIFVGRWWISSLAVSIPALVLSIANYYTLVFRNSPISTQDLHNAKTAISVMGSYKFPLNVYVIAIIVFFALSVLVTREISKREKKQARSIKKRLLHSCLLFAFGAVFVYQVYLAENPIKPRNTFVWSWEDSYYKYGFVASSVEVFQNSINMVTKADGYDEAKLKSIADEHKANDKKTRTPDIIFILNETFYDMRDLVDISKTSSAMPFIDSLPDAQKGKAVVAGTGGGTNKSEYEFLTSNSVQLMSGITPFNYLSFDDANSIVSHLESLGYSSWAGHCAEELNYSRGIVYPKLGFDNILFRPQFGEAEKYGVRPYATDEFCYDKMLVDYEKMGDGPRFMYLLTIQNHGGWDINPEEEDIIKVAEDFGENTDIVSEFLSCVKLSDKAFENLTKYFENSDREVIICMVGDHAPSFATELVENIDLETTFNLRTTPYVVWANFELEKELPSLTSIPYMAPMVLDVADCPTTPFYDYMADMQNKIPVITAFSLYKTENGETLNYEDENEYKDTIDTYFGMVYNNASPDANRVQKLFRTP